MFLFSLVCERELSLYYPISEILVYGLLKSLKSFSGKTKCLIDDEVFMAINLIAAYVKMLHYKMFQKGLMLIKQMSQKNA